jgi:hypothetical protein
MFTTPKQRSESTVQGFHWRILAVLAKMIHPAVSWYIGVSYCEHFVKFTNYLMLKIVANCNQRTNASLDPGIVAIAILATTVIAPVNQAIATAGGDYLQSFHHAEVIAHRLGEPICHLGARRCATQYSLRS